MLDKIELGKRIRDARNKAGYTREVREEKAEMGAMYLGEIERGVKMPSMKSFVKIVEALDISADYILRNELSSGGDYVFDEVTQKLAKLSPQQRKTAVDILDAYLKNL